MLNIVAKSYHTRITICQFIFKIELNHEKNSSTAFGKCVQNPTFTFISILLQRRYFFVRLKKQNAMPGWCSIIFVLVLFLSYLKERNKKISKEPLKKILQQKRTKTFACFDSIYLMLSSLKLSFLS